MAPRKKAAASAEKTKPVAAAAGKTEFTFGEAVEYSEIPPKTNFGEAFKHIAALGVGQMLPVGGAKIAAMRNTAKKVVKELGAREFDYRYIESDEFTGTNVYRLA